MGAQGIIAAASSDDGMGKLARDQFEAALLRLVGPWLGATRVIPALACGMVGARQGWQEAAYRAVPCPPLDALGMQGNRVWVWVVALKFFDMGFRYRTRRGAPFVSSMFSCFTHGFPNAIALPERRKGASRTSGDPVKRTLGVCYYPEHWPEQQWTEDAARMAEIDLPDGLRRRDAGEFTFYFNCNAESIDYEGKTIHGAEVHRQRRI